MASRFKANMESVTLVEKMLFNVLFAETLTMKSQMDICVMNVGSLDLQSLISVL